MWIDHTNNYDDNMKFVKEAVTNKAFENAVSLPCTHKVNKATAEEFIKKKLPCPLCKKSFSGFIPDQSFQGLVERFTLLAKENLNLANENEQLKLQMQGKSPAQIPNDLRVQKLEQQIKEIYQKVATLEGKPNMIIAQNKELSFDDFFEGCTFERLPNVGNSLNYQMGKMKFVIHLQQTKNGLVFQTLTAFFYIKPDQVEPFKKLFVNEFIDIPFCHCKNPDGVFAKFTYSLVARDFLRWATKWAMNCTQELILMSEHENWKLN